MRKALAADLNVLLERELKVKQAIIAKQREKETVDQQIHYGNASERLRLKQETLGKEIAELMRTGSFYETNRFAGVKLSDYVRDFIAQNPQSHTRIRLNRLLLEEAYPGRDRQEPRRCLSRPRNLHPFPGRFRALFQRIHRRCQAAHGDNPPQLRPGEDVKMDQDSGRVQVAGQVAVMAINGLLTKVIFDQNPKNDFYVEESFPLDWMYPHLTPYGIIMKINRNPLPVLNGRHPTQADHEFWSKYSKRRIGNWITNETSVRDIAAFWLKKFTSGCGFTGFEQDAADASVMRTMRSRFPNWQLHRRHLRPARQTHCSRNRQRAGQIARADPAAASQLRRRAPGSRLRLPAGVRFLPLQPGSRLSLRQPPVPVRPLR